MARTNPFERFNAFEIVRNETKDGLNREVWRFRMHGDYSSWICALDHYSKQTRPTRRHGWRKVEHWDGFARRGNTIDTQPMLPSDVREEAKARAAEKFTTHLKFQ